MTGLSKILPLALALALTSAAWGQASGPAVDSATAARIFQAACVDARADESRFKEAGRALGLRESGNRFFHPSADLLIDWRIGQGNTPRCLIRYKTTDRGNRIQKPFKVLPALKRQDKDVLQVRGSRDFVLITHPETVRGPDYVQIVYVVRK